MRIEKWEVGLWESCLSGLRGWVVRESLRKCEGDISQQNGEDWGDWAVMVGIMMKIVEEYGD